ncbi:hypothetical protein BpHYR1_043237 [Brachionus plicatilis]|uniref:Uncharacterized protein n=1 Tax=Brachionus plicatilis TaxID=10195 RepID=A0A3M7QCG1_BRAPC|nr:hypothetical protein BpHYR1_043237 [Brachionus plicatilis]
MNRPLDGWSRSLPFFFLAGNVASRPAPNTNNKLTSRYSQYKALLLYLKFNYTVNKKPYFFDIIR